MKSPRTRAALALRKLSTTSDDWGWLSSTIMSVANNFRQYEEGITVEYTEHGFWEIRLDTVLMAQCSTKDGDWALGEYYTQKITREAMALLAGPARNIVMADDRIFNTVLDKTPHTIDEALKYFNLEHLRVQSEQSEEFIYEPPGIGKTQLVSNSNCTVVQFELNDKTEQEIHSSPKREEQGE